ncbi:hypothetical protein IKG64_01555 [Candidatus Saccharibacteria bacterium]|nr:hypothetical protein [Candidatus Saccharibacteria bacterium]MBR3055982.1 hypothetical protein [Candidatus Saccharibacteria bacterium]
MTKRYIDFAPKKSSGARLNAARPAASSGAAARVGAVRRTTSARDSSVTVRLPDAGNVSVARRSVANVRPSGALRPVASRRVVRKTVVAQPRVKVMKADKPAISGTGTSLTNKSRASAVRLGEIEDIKFINTNVPKRALGGAGRAASGVAKVGTRGVAGMVNRTSTASSAGAVKSAVGMATSAKSKKIGARIGLRSKTKGNSTRATMEQEAKVSGVNVAYNLPRTPFINQDKVAKRPLSKNIYQKEIDALAKSSSTVAGGVSNKAAAIISKPEKESKMGVIIAIILTIILGAVAGTVAFLLLPK